MKYLQAYRGSTLVTDKEGSLHSLDYMDAI